MSRSELSYCVTVLPPWGGRGEGMGADGRSHWTLYPADKASADGSIPLVYGVYCSHTQTCTHTATHSTHAHAQRLHSISNLLFCVKGHFADLRMLSTVDATVELRQALTPLILLSADYALHVLLQEEQLQRVFIWKMWSCEYIHVNVSFILPFFFYTWVK